MMIDSNLLIPISDANQNFSKVVQLVDEGGMAVILTNNQPKYLVVDFKEYDEIKTMREKLIDKVSDEILTKNLEAFRELAK